jgi:uncharacterized protein YhaN
VIITECVLHGFRGFAEPFTLRLRPGLNLVSGGNESGKSTLCEAILAALFAPPTSTDFLSWSLPGVCRVLLFFSAAEGRFHLVKDFVGHSADLAAWDAAQGTFVSMAQDPSHIAALLAKDLGGVSEATYRGLCLLQPPLRVPTAAAPEPTPAARAASGLAAPEKTQEAKRERLQELRKSLETHRKIRETEALLDSLRAQYEEAGTALQGLGGLEEERRSAREALKELQGLEGLTAASLLPQIAEYQKALQRRDEEVRGLDQRLEEVQARLAVIPSAPLFRYPLFLAGAALLLVSVLAAQFLPYMGVGIFAGLGCAAVAFIQYFNRSQSRDKVRKSLAALEYQRDKGLDLRISRQFQALLDWLPRAGCQDVSALAARLRQRDALREQLAGLEAKIADLSSGADSAALEGKRRSLGEAIQVAEDEIRSLGFVPEPAEIQREIDKIERGLASAAGAAHSAAASSSQPLGALLETLAGHLGPVGLSRLSTVDAQASALIAEITAERYTRVRRTPEGDLRLVLAGSQEGLAPGEVSEGTRDQAMLAWQLALLAVCLQDSAVPLLLDNPFLRVDPERRKRLLPFLQRLARTHQVILFSHEAWIPPESAHIVLLSR